MKLYGIYDMSECLLMTLGRPRLIEICRSKETAEKRLAEISEPEYTTYTASDFFFDGMKHGHEGEIRDYSEFIEFVKTVPGFVLIADNLGNLHDQKVIVYDKSKTKRLDPKGGYGCVEIRTYDHEATHYEIREVEVAE